MTNEKKQALEHPSRDDVHEQREPDQKREAVVEKPGPRDPNVPATKPVHPTKKQS